MFSFRDGLLDSWRGLQQPKALEDQQGLGLEFAGIAHAEQSEWESFLFAVGGRDSWREPSFCRWPRSLDFSWGYRREGGRLLERLDRFYVNNWAIGRGGASRVVPETTLSDHAPVILSLDTATHSLSPYSCKVPNSIYTKAEVHSRIVDTWDQEWDPQVSQALAESSNIC